MSKHTPGPWFAHGRYIGTKNHKSTIAECRDINGNWSDDAKSSGNARLIAAAPELLEVLKRITSAVNFNGTCHPLFDGMQEQITDAIAKAEGRS